MLYDSPCFSRIVVFSSELALGPPRMFTTRASGSRRPSPMPQARQPTMQWVWCVCLHTVLRNGSVAAGTLRANPRSVAGSPPKQRMATASACRAGMLPIEANTIRSVVCVRAVKRRIASPS